MKPLSKIWTVIDRKIESVAKYIIGPPHETVHYLTARMVRLNVEWHHAHVMINCKDVVPFPRWRLLAALVAPLTVSVGLLLVALWVYGTWRSFPVWLMIVFVVGCQDDALKSLALILGHVYDEEGNKLV